jgi:signal transduction histidine kinase
MARLFQTIKPTGVGIGLSIWRSIIEAYRGRIWAEKNPARGTILSVILPSAVDAEGAGPKP